MSHDIPLGKKEGPRLEFKGAAALKAPKVLGHGIVAMLNAEGGEVWVGLREENERAVAIDPIADPEGERRRLLDHLVDAIEPWLSAEIEVESQPSEEGFVLRIVARPEPRHRPYALLKSGGRQYVIRVGPRIRPMTREELKRRFSERASMPPSSEEQALDSSSERWFRSNGSTTFEESEDLLWEKPLVFSADEIENEPDRCGYRLVERVYEAFGYRREQIPAEFDTKSGRLLLPE